MPTLHPYPPVHFYHCTAAVRPLASWEGHAGVAPGFRRGWPSAGPSTGPSGRLRRRLRGWPSLPGAKPGADPGADKGANLGEYWSPSNDSVERKKPLLSLQTFYALFVTIFCIKDELYICQEFNRRILPCWLSDDGWLLVVVMSHQWPLATLCIFIGALCFIITGVNGAFAVSLHCWQTSSLYFLKHCSPW